MTKDGKPAWFRYALYITAAIIDGWLTAEGPTHGSAQIVWLVSVLLLWALLAIGVLMLTVDSVQKEALRRAVSPDNAHRLILAGICVVLALAALVRFRNAWFFTHAPLWLFLLVVLGPFIVLNFWFKYRKWRHGRIE